MTAVIVALVAAASTVSCAVNRGSLTREETQGQWIHTDGGHTVTLDLASDGTVAVTGIPVTALTLYDDPDAAVGDLDWSTVTDLSGTWSYYEPYDGNPPSISSSLTDTANQRDVSAQLEFSGTSLVIWYGYVEYSEHVVFTRAAKQEAQPDVLLLPRATFVGTWVGGTTDHEATVSFDVDGSMEFSNLPLDLVRSDGAAEIDWSRTISFPARWTWANDPVTPESSVYLHIYPRPSGVEFDGTTMDVLISGSSVTLRMHSGQVTWDRHLVFHRATDEPLQPDD